MKQACVCILAYNEQSHIARTIHAVLNGNEDVDFDIIVYANGCTDRTADLVRELSDSIPNLRLRELDRASKPNAWNTAFAENTNPILLFSDGDVIPEPGSVSALTRHLQDNPSVSLICSELWPNKGGLTAQQRLVGFLQIPLVQDFHVGGFYAVRRDALDAALQAKQLTGIPEGVAGEDGFVELLFAPAQFRAATKKVYYDPPALDDYCRYLARIRWQNEQLAEVYPEFLERSTLGSRPVLLRLRDKVIAANGIGRFLLGVSSTASRCLFKTVFRRRIHAYYLGLGPVVRDGESILGTATRSESTK